MRFSFAITSLLAGACGSASQEPLPTTCEIQKDIPMDANRNIDLLIVIDSSPVMAEEQAALAFNAPRFMNVLETIEGGPPWVHIGVITADMGAGDASVPGCSVAGDDGVLHGGFIRDVALPDGSRDRNYSGDLVDEFVARADVGASGCRFSQPFAAVRRALDGSQPANAGFLRDEAYLFVLFITSQDDCSATSTDLFTSGDTFACTQEGIICDASGCLPNPGSQLVEDPAAFVDFLRGVKEDDGNIMVAGVFGNPTPVTINGGVLEPSCQADPVSGQPGVRLYWMLDRFPNRNTMTSICNEDWSDALNLLADMLRRVIGNPCLDGPIDTTDLDPDERGLQLQCSVTDVYRLGTDQEEQTVIPRCDMADDGTPAAGNALPCWWAQEDLQTCSSTQTGLIGWVERGEYEPYDTTTVFRCAAAECS